MIQNPARKGDAVALEMRHSSTTVHGLTNRYTTWCLATVAESRRDGYVRKVIIAGHSHSIDVARVGNAHTITPPAYQSAARRMIAASSYPAAEYETATDLRTAIIAEAERDAVTA